MKPLWKQSRKKIYSYLDIVKIALTPPPAVLNAYKDFAKKMQFFK